MIAAMNILSFFRSLFSPEPEAIRPDPPTQKIEFMTTSQKIYSQAKKDIGLKETPGKGSTPRIRDSIKQAAKWLDGDDSETSWCACIRGTWGLETATGVPKEHYKAARWLNWGEPVAINDPWSWRQGDTLIFRRDGGNHVALLDSVVWPDPEKKSRPTHLRALGGNQSNSVNVSSFPISALIGVRR